VPFVDLDPSQVPLTLSPDAKMVTPGAEEFGPTPPAQPTTGEVWRAAFRGENPIGSAVANFGVAGEDALDPNYNPWDEIKGTKYEPAFRQFADAKTPAHTMRIKERLDQIEQDKRDLASSSWGQYLPAMIASALIDPTNLIPGGAFVKGAKGGFAVAKSALSVGVAAGVSTMASEGVISATQQGQRSIGESAAAVGASVILGGLLGAGGAALLSKSEWRKAVEALDADVARAGTASPVPDVPAGVSGGAAAVRAATLEENTIAGRAAGSVARATERLNPNLRVMQSPSAEVRDIGSRLFENTLYLKKNFDGVASEPAVETLAKEWNGGLAKAVQATRDNFDAAKKAGLKMTEGEFQDAVSKAMRRGDVGDHDAITKAARDWRSQVFDPLKEAAIKAKLLPEDVTIDTADSYLTRMWNRNALVAREGEFKAIVEDWLRQSAPKWVAEFDRVTAERAAKLKGDALAEFNATRRVEREARFGDMKGSLRETANEVFDTLTGKAQTGARPDFITVKARGPLKERTFHIPDALVEQFLENNIDQIGRRYVRVMAADVELARKFGSPDMAEQIAKINADYQRMRAGMTDEKALLALEKRRKADVEDIEAVRDMLRGTYNVADHDTIYASGLRAMNHINYLRSMGEVVLASLTDALRPAMVHGLKDYMGGLAQLATNMRAVRLSTHEARLAGNITESVLAHRFAAMTDIMDPYAARGPVEAFIGNMTNVASKWNGIRVWTDGMKSIASLMTQNRIVDGVMDFGKIKPSERAYLAYLGIDQNMADRIGKQFAEHGDTLDGVRVANTQKWSDPQAVRAYRAAINKDVDSIIIQQSVADIPLFAKSPTGRALLQFKSFALASHQRILLRGLQEDHARFLGGVVSMTAMGMLMTYLKAWSGNRPEAREKMLSNVGWWIGEGLDRSGIFSAPMELANTLEKMSGVNVMKDPFKALDSATLESQRIQNRSVAGAILGPSVGMIDDAATTAKIPLSMWKGEDITKQQKSAAERLLPFNSYFGLRQIIRYVVNPPD